MDDRTPKSCTKCGGDGPLAPRRSECSTCYKAYMRAYYLRNREKAIANAKAAYDANREEISAARKERYAARTPAQVQERYEYNRDYYAAGRDWHLTRNAEWRAANPDKHREAARRWRAANEEHVRERQKKWRERTAERRAEALRAWHAANPEKVKAARWRRKANLRGAPSSNFSGRQLADRIAYFGGLCWMCKEPYAHLDHVKPLSRGGSHMLANIRPACASCNLSKKNKWGGPAWTETLKKRGIA